MTLTTPRGIWGTDLVEYSRLGEILDYSDIFMRGYRPLYWCLVIHYEYENYFHVQPL